MHGPRQGLPAGHQRFLPKHLPKVLLDDPGGSPLFALPTPKASVLRERSRLGWAELIDLKVAHAQGTCDGSGHRKGARMAFSGDGTVARIGGAKVVEDVALIAMGVETILRDAGYAVLGPCASASDALAVLAAEMPDAALLDIGLADGSAAPVAEKPTAAGVPFVVVTAMRPTGPNTRPFPGRRISPSLSARATWSWPWQGCSLTRQPSGTTPGRAADRRSVGPRARRQRTPRP